MKGTSKSQNHHEGNHGSEAEAGVSSRPCGGVGDTAGGQGGGSGRGARGSPYARGPPPSACVHNTPCVRCRDLEVTGPPWRRSHEEEPRGGASRSRSHGVREQSDTAQQHGEDVRVSWVSSWLTRPLGGLTFNTMETW
ncbi:hypothetical protein EYF80_052157 [Liparis tanakae]|uniref:Uncharacterized protein n=1 Tax=Liparis tanakae TaxID=230148 RepID=A0A4Z2FBA5_9TELE|nr:hypothetical protein EYF80_052157 [Liparis tanakae]